MHRIPIDKQSVYILTQLSLIRMAECGHLEYRYMFQVPPATNTAHAGTSASAQFQKYGSHYGNKQGMNKSYITTLSSSYSKIWELELTDSQILMTMCMVIKCNFSIKQTFTDLVLCLCIEEMYMLTYMHMFLPT